MKKIIYGAIAGATAIQVQSTNAILDFGQQRAVNLESSAGPIEEFITLFLQYLVSFLYLIAVILAIYGGFLILTAAGDDEKVSKGRKVIFQAIIGLIVIFLANAIIEFIVRSLFGV